MKKVEDIMSNRDHAYVPICLLQKNKVKCAIAADVRKGPLIVANKNIAKYDMTSVIETKLGNGLDVVTEKCDCVIIAGMGGILITELIKNNLSKAKNINQLIIQAMNNEELVRKYLLSEGFSITFEKLIKEGYKIYNAMSVTYTASNSEYKEYEYYTSRYLIENHDRLLALYLKPKLKRLCDIIKGQQLKSCADKTLIDVKKEMEEIVNDCKRCH
jgi:tRNA (adenine22-N1)-methyltransferase